MTGLTIRRAQLRELPDVYAFYCRLIDDMQALEYHPMWQKGVYPTEEMLSKACAADELFLTLWEGRIIGAMIVNHRATEGYDRVHWPTEARGDEVTLIHALGVLPEFSRRGVAKAMVAEVIRLAREGGGKAIRLDVLEENLPAHRLYRGAGFVWVERLLLFYEDTGWHNFDLYELKL